MRLTSALALALLLSPALAAAQAGGDAKAAAEAAPEADGGPGDDAAPAAPAPEQSLQVAAYIFFQGLISGIPEAAAEMADLPFDLDGEILKTRRQLVRRLEKMLARGGLGRLTFYGIRAFPAEEMERRFGAPPDRLGELDLEGAWVAVANLGGRGYAAVFKKRGDAWLAVAYTD